ncbi:MAG: hypothetical protein JJ839_001025 [Prochlorococcus marinus CUG1430]|nr:hypothetical protein [Prochlorococcus marinus CUG1430]
MYLLAGDIGFKIFDEFIDKFPDRFINCGIAEQNMVSVAAGLASEGKIVFVYTIIPFLIMRAYEQIRVDIGINNQNVILVGVGGGLAYDKLGSTHHSCEDIALARTIPNLNIFCPFDPQNVVDTLNKSYLLSKDKKEPSYIRLSKGGENNLENRVKLFENIFCFKSKNLSKNIILTHGSISYSILSEIDSNNIDASLICLSKINNDSIKVLVEIISNLEKESNILIIEEHYQSGGLYEALASELLPLNLKHNFSNMNLKHKYIFEIYGHKELLKKSGLDMSLIKQYFSS